MGTFGGKLVKHTCVDLQEIAAKAALAAGGIKPELIDSVIVGNVISVRTTRYFDSNWWSLFFVKEEKKVPLIQTGSHCPL
jgi:hypothetical protein